MMNISENTKMTGFEKTGCSIGHILECFRNKKMHGNVRYTYFGPRVQKGTVDIYTKNGTFRVHFVNKDAWAKELAFVCA